MTGMTEKKQKKAAPPSPENVYHVLAGSDPDLAARDGILYRWTGGFWAAQDVTVEESRAFRWLQAEYPDKATPPIARRCVEAAVMGATPLPAPEKSAVVLPLQNVYLHIDTKTGAIETLPPDKKSDLHTRSRATMIRTRGRHGLTSFCAKFCRTTRTAKATYRSTLDTLFCTTAAIRQHSSG